MSGCSLSWHLDVDVPEGVISPNPISGGSQTSLPQRNLSKDLQAIGPLNTLPFNGTGALLLNELTSTLKPTISSAETVCLRYRTERMSCRAVCHILWSTVRKVDSWLAPLQIRAILSRPSPSQASCCQIAYQ